MGIINASNFPPNVLVRPSPIGIFIHINFYGRKEKYEKHILIDSVQRSYLLNFIIFLSILIIKMESIKKN